MTAVVSERTAHGLDDAAFVAALTVIAERAEEHDRTGAFPFAALRALHEIGAPALVVATELGGHGAGIAEARER
ncbi:acyl-CoA dehydrogenase family protein [Nocardia sp. NPDC005366]|uniref:acyl-CoA dehydrogenase family protein n=1 Tax=Nocardia sp. NPDC005366 TaxID=3156878 RepID=UPI0033B784BA